MSKLKYIFLFILMSITTWYFILHHKDETFAELSASVNAIRESKTQSQGSTGFLVQNNKENIDKAVLGRDLFLDKRLSKDNTISCNSCHDLQHGGADSRQFSVGINGRTGNANSPSVFNSVFNFKQFWDGRAETLNEQVEGPLHNPMEMGSTWEEIVMKLSQDPTYIERFKKIYMQEINPENIKDALVEFEKTLVTLNAPFDQYIQGNQKALSEKQLAGYKKFSAYGCVSCHQGQNIGGNMFQTLGVTANYFKDRGGFYESDLGRYNVTKLESDRHVFKVPSLRNVALTAPYFHDGSTKTLPEAVHKMAKYQLGRKLTEEDVAEIVAFLESLTGDLPESVKLIKREVSNEKQSN